MPGRALERAAVGHDAALARGFDPVDHVGPADGQVRPVAGRVEVGEGGRSSAPVPTALTGWTIASVPGRVGEGRVPRRQLVAAEAAGPGRAASAHVADRGSIAAWLQPWPHSS